MSNYILLNNSNTLGTLPPVPVVRPVSANERGNLSVLSGNILDPSLAITPPSQQAFQLTVSGTGAVSASVQLYVSNDGSHWLTLGAPMTATGTNSASVGANGTVPFAFFGALLTAISGTGATATVTMSC